MLCYSIFILLIISIISSNCANVITAFDYLTSVGENPDVYLTTPQIIRRHGYASESHVVETQDGYLLTLHRIPSNKHGEKGGQPVLLQHGLLSSSADWVDAGDKSVAFMLSDAGYDVWLGNARGNTYSTAHISLSPHSAQFWNFSFHEMGIYDVPTTLNHIANISGKGGDIIYIGHSMGTTMFFVFSSLFPTQAKLVKVMVAFAPVVYMTHLRSPIRYLAPFSKDIDWLATHLGINQFLPNGKILKLLSYECELANYTKEICENIIFILCGFDEKELGPDLLPVIFSHAPAGSSVKTLVHYSQEIENYGNFQCFDYGQEGNLKEYGTATPPSYNLTNIKVPTYLMYGDNDNMVSPIDVSRLVSKLPINVGTYEVPFKGFNHVDYLWAKDAPKLVYEPLLKFLLNYVI